MKIEILAIGDEILSGDIVNTNAGFLSKELGKMGYRIFLHTVISDEEGCLKNGLQAALQRSDLILATGGLGPTFDDKTKKIVAEVFGYELKYDVELAARLVAKYGDDEYTKSQAYIFAGAENLKNEIGTASGFILEKNG